jgi:hypothetical protein
VAELRGHLLLAAGGADPVAELPGSAAPPDLINAPQAATGERQMSALSRSVR